MMSSGKAWRNFWAIVFLGFHVVQGTGCSGKPVDENDPASMYADAEEDIKNDRYLIAIEKLRTIKNKFPYSSYSPKAQLRIADVYFLQESFIEAAAAYEVFRDLYPKNADAPYALYRVAESYSQDTPSNVSRDLGSAYRSAEAAREFLRLYPSDARAKDVNAILEKSLNQQAEKEFYIAEYYFKQKRFKSAKGRYEKLIAHYPQSPLIAKAKEKLEESLKRIEKN